MVTVRDLFGALDPTMHITIAREKPEGLYPVIKGPNRYQLTELPIWAYKQHAHDIVRKVKTLPIDGEPTTVIILL